MPGFQKLFRWGCLLAFSSVASAHHSTAPYDLVHGTILEATVTRFDWENPHSHLFADVQGEDRVVEHWSVELDGVGALRRLGWSKETLKPGDHVVVTGGRAKDGSFHLRAVRVQLPDGRTLNALPAPEH